MASIDQSNFQDFLPLMAEKLGGDGLIGELCNGFQLLMDADKGVITFDSLKKNAALLGLQDFSDDDLYSMLKEGDFDGDGALNQMEFCVLMFRLSPELMEQSQYLLEEALPQEFPYLLVRFWLQMEEGSSCDFSVHHTFPGTDFWEFFRIISQSKVLMLQCFKPDLIHSWTSLAWSEGCKCNEPLDCLENMRSSKFPHKIVMLFYYGLLEFGTQISVDQASAEINAWFLSFLSHGWARFESFSTSSVVELKCGSTNVLSRFFM